MNHLRQNAGRLDESSYNMQEDDKGDAAMRTNCAKGSKKAWTVEFTSETGIT